MRIRLICAAILLISVPSFSQEYRSLDFLNKLTGKKYATWGDAVAFYAITVKKASAGFEADVKTLQQMGITKDSDYGKDDTLRKGMLARMIARHLDLKDSLLYLIFKTERYAHRACVAERFFDSDSSEWDPVSGDELIEIMTSVSERMEKASE
jgi:hypothetical protein